jgi:hypothetical protein
MAHQHTMNWQGSCSRRSFIDSMYELDLPENQLLAADLKLAPPDIDAVVPRPRLQRPLRYNG